MTESRLTEAEERLCEISEILRLLLEDVSFSGGLAFTVARRTGVKLPYGIEAINNPHRETWRRILALTDPVLNPDGANEREGGRSKTWISGLYEWSRGLYGRGPTRTQTVARAHFAIVPGNNREKREMTKSRLTEAEKRLCEISEILRRLLEASSFNGALAFTIARQTGVKLPYGIETINNPTEKIWRRILALTDPVLNPDGANEREEPRPKTWVSGLHEGRVVYRAEDEPEPKP